MLPQSVRDLLQPDLSPSAYVERALSFGDLAIPSLVRHPFVRAGSPGRSGIAAPGSPFTLRHQIRACATNGRKERQLLEVLRDHDADAASEFRLLVQKQDGACGYKLANDGHDTRAIQAYLGHRNIQNTTRYTELAPGRFKGFWQFGRARCPFSLKRDQPRCSSPAGCRHCVSRELRGRLGAGRSSAALLWLLPG